MFSTSKNQTCILVCTVKLQIRNVINEALWIESSRHLVLSSTSVSISVSANYSVCSEAEVCGTADFISKRGTKLNSSNATVILGAVIQTWCLPTSNVEMKLCCLTSVFPSAYIKF